MAYYSVSNRPIKIPRKYTFENSFSWWKIPQFSSICSQVKVFLSKLLCFVVFSCLLWIVLVHGVIECILLYTNSISTMANLSMIEVINVQTMISLIFIDNKFVFRFQKTPSYKTMMNIYIDVNIYEKIVQIILIYLKGWNKKPSIWHLLLRDLWIMSYLKWTPSLWKLKYMRVKNRM